MLFKQRQTSESLEIVKLLLERGADPNKQGGYYDNALQAVTRQGNLEMVKLLLSHNADVTIQPKSISRRSLLHVAVESGDLAVLETLWDAGAGIHLTTQDESGSTPLHVAVDKGGVAIAKYILDHGASPDIEDLGDTNSFQLAMRKKNREMVLLLYPKTTAGLSKITASDWRLCSGGVSNCNLEMVSDQSAKVVFRDKSLERELVERSYPLSGRTKSRAHFTDFMNKHRIGKRMFILADGTMLPPQAEFSVHCRWWHLSHGHWEALMSSAPSQNTVRQTTAEDCFLECALSFDCYALPENMDLWPNDVQLEADALQEFQSRQGILWIMMKSGAYEVYDSRNLESRIFFSTSEYAEIPKTATDLLCPLVLKVQSIWGQNFSRFQKHLGLMRTRILRSSGSDPSLIQYLLIDAKLLEILKENFTKQIENLQSFRDWYQNESARVLHQLPPDEVKKKMQDFTKASDELQTTTGRQLSILTESSQNLIQLEFNLTSIAEAQRSTSTNKSMKRLSWITFIFLPLVFIASLFGMNVDVLKSNPAWWWYLPFATLTTLLTFVVWIVFKRNKTLEGSLETRFRWLFQRPKGEEDLEMGSESGLNGLRGTKRVKESDKSFLHLGRKDHSSGRGMVGHDKNRCLSVWLRGRARSFLRTNND
ncbi:hypothetical protein HO173_013258 [Letharia columbiana]|uniref:Uncharacterized protein n=1 Tax=Letharia columbiana TaxID=112416 RepID=A0A8H6FCT6_9LECA|nr:uncharacterized protein HO173_013258 [Letharia columbiana]KAF6223158.1 hypothetical protein HO173_013258 [Letharia columbiana]